MRKNVAVNFSMFQFTNGALYGFASVCFKNLQRSVYINIKQSYNVLEKVFLCIGSLLGFFLGTDHFPYQIPCRAQIRLKDLWMSVSTWRWIKRTEAQRSLSIRFCQLRSLSLALSRRKWKPHPQVCLLTRCAPAATTTTTTGGGRFTLSVWWNTHTQPKESLRCNKSTNFRDWEQLI